MFKPYKNLPMGNQDYFSAIIGNNQTLAIGDAITSGAAAAGSSSFVYGAGSASIVLAVPKILGVVVGFLPINQTGGSNVTQEVSSYAASNANQTTGGQIRAKYIPARLVDLWVADTSGALGLTTGSNGVGYFTLSTNATLHEPSYIAPNTTSNRDGATTLQFASFGAAATLVGAAAGFSTSQVIGTFNSYI